MSDPFTDVVFAAAELRIAALPQYDKFLETLRQLEERLMDDLIAADVNVIFPAQGKVQLLSQLRKKLENCIKLRDEVIRRK